MDRPRFSRPELVFMLAVPLGWATLLLFHPNPTKDIRAELHGEATPWLVVHLGSLVFIGLMSAVLRMLVRDLPGRAARISRLAITPFVLLYGAGEAILGVATGVQAIWNDVIAADVIMGLGSIALGGRGGRRGGGPPPLGAPLGIAGLLARRR